MYIWGGKGLPLFSIQKDLGWDGYKKDLGFYLLLALLTVFAINRFEIEHIVRVVCPLKLFYFFHPLSPVFCFFSV